MDKELEINIKLAEHDKDIIYLKNEISSLNKMADEIHVMAMNISTLTTEIKHTNEHILSSDKYIEKTEKRLNELELQPSKKWNLITTTIISVLTSSIVGSIAGILIKTFS